MDPPVSGIGTTTLQPPPAMSNRDSVQVSKASQTKEYEESLKIVLGTVFGVFGVVGIILIAVLLYRFYKNRNQSNRSGSSDRNPSLHRSVSIDLEQKQVPTVLLLYSYDCSAHEKVVEALAGFLIETCNCNVNVDMFEEQIIHERGLDDWLVDNMQEAEFIIVLSSIGARLRCSKKKVKFKLDPAKTLPDYFAVAVDYVAEKMRVERSKGMPLTTFCVAYMDYSTESDIPPQLEMAFKFCLMKDITALFCHLHGIHGEPTKDGAPIVGLTPDTYDTSEMGQELKVAIESAKEYFKSNPDWVEDRIEPVPNPNKSKSRHARKSSHEPLLMAPSHIDTTLPARSYTRNRNDVTETLPNLSGDNSQLLPLIPLKNHQTSFPSSLDSRNNLTLSMPPLQQNTKSCDSFPPESLNHCDLCGHDGHAIGSQSCKMHLLLDIPAQEMGSEENVKLKSKSMPAVNRNSLYSSQTIFRAEVHKEWDDHESRLSQADSNETSSNHDSIIDDLEKDLDSIMNPSHYSRPCYSHTSYDNLAGVYRMMPVPAKIENISELPSMQCSSGDSGRDVSDHGHREAVGMQMCDTDTRHVDQIQLETLYHL